MWPVPGDGLPEMHICTDVPAPSCPYAYHAVRKDEPPSGTNVETGWVDNQREKQSKTVQPLPLQNCQVLGARRNEHNLQCGSLSFSGYYYDSSISQPLDKRSMLSARHWPQGST